LPRIGQADPGRRTPHFEVVLSHISSATIKDFFCQNIICRYGVPQHIIADNAKQFNNHMFKDFCHQIGMKVAFTSVYHLQSNGVVERPNALIFEAINKILEGEKKGQMGWSYAEGSMESQHHSL
jgi:hypothetical protein